MQYKARLYQRALCGFRRRRPGEENKRSNKQEAKNTEKKLRALGRVPMPVNWESIKSSARRLLAKIVPSRNNRISTKL